MPRTAGIERMVVTAEAKHYVNAPGHAHAMLQQLAGVVTTLRDRLPDDPALAAYAISDQLPTIIGLVKDLRWWSQAVIECDPGDIPESGARLCP